MKARLVRIGNSRGIRLPKPVIEEVGLADEVELSVQEGAIVIRPVNGTRVGWAAAAEQLAARNEGLLHQPTITQFDREDWTW